MSLTLKTPALLLCAAFCTVVLTGQQPASNAVYTTNQAAAGRAVYDASCAVCHRPDLAD